MGDRVTNTVANNANVANTATGNYTAASTKSVDDGTVKDTGVIAALGSAPTTVKKEDYAKQAAGNYTGINEASAGAGYVPAINETRKVVSDVNGINGGLSSRGNVLRETYKSPQYSRGENNLDSFLLGAGSEGQKAVSNISNTYGNFGDNLTGAVNGVTKGIEAGKATTKKTKDDTDKAYTGAVKGTTDYFDETGKAVTASNAKGTKDYNDILANLGSTDAKIRSAAYKAIGLDDATGEWLRSQGYDPAKIIQQGQAQNLGDVVDQKKVTDYKALLDLVGGSSAYDFTASGNTGKYSASAPQIEAAKKASTNSAAIQKRLVDEQKKRDWSLDLVNGEAAGTLGTDPVQAAKDLGISPQDYAEALRLGVNLTGYLKGNRKLTAGDVTTEAERKEFGGLMSLLGLAGPDYKDPGDEGAGYTFDTAGFNAALTAARAAKTPQPSETTTNFVPEESTPNEIPPAFSGSEQTSMNPNNNNKIWEDVATKPFTDPLDIPQTTRPRKPKWL